MSLGEISIFSSFLSGIRKSRLSISRVRKNVPPFELLSKHSEDVIWFFGSGDFVQPFKKKVVFNFPEECRNDDAKYVTIIGDSWWNTIDEIKIECNRQPPSAVVVSVDYLYRLSDPRPVLLALKKILLLTQFKLFFFGSHDKNCDQFWCESDVLRFLEMSGFYIKEIERFENNTLIEMFINKISYRKYLSRMKFSEDLIDADFLLLSTEDASLKPTGGIGTYVANVKRLNCKCATVICDLKTTAVSIEGRTILAQDVLGTINSETFLEGNGLIELVRVVLYLLPNIEVCEYQDYLSIGFRVLQAKRTGGLPRYLWLRTFLHGSVDYLKYGTQKECSAIYTKDDIKTAVKDRYVFKYSDECWVPSAYLLNLMNNEFAHKVNNVKMTRLPFDLKCIPEGDRTYGCIKKIIFIGKYSHLKGWPDFLAAIKGLAGESAFANVEELISVGPGNPSKEDVRLLRSIKRYRNYSFSHLDLMDFLAKNRESTLVVIPSRGENYPNIILEQLLLGMRFVAYNSGGAVEVVDDGNYVERFFANPNPLALSSKIIEVLLYNPQEHGQIVSEKSEYIRERQKIINKSFESTSVGFKLPPLEIDYKKLADVSVVTPFYNGSIEFLRELYLSIFNSNVMPSEWIIVDDGSDDRHKLLLKDFLSSIDRGVIRVRIVHQENRGLAGARNLGLVSTTSKYAFFIDCDDMLMPHTISDCLVAFAADDNLIAATGFAVYFENFESIPDDPSLMRNGVYWKPIGVPEAKAFSLFENQYLTSCVMVNVEKARQVGGWDDLDRSVWEDWGFYTRLAWSGIRFSLIPNIGYWYRNTPGSMSKTYNKYFGYRRLARSVKGIDRLDVTTIVSMGFHLDSELTPRESQLLTIFRKFKVSWVGKCIAFGLQAIKSKTIKK